MNPRAPDRNIASTRRGTDQFELKTGITLRHIAIISLALLSVLVGFLLLLIPEQYQLSVVFAIPASIGVMLIILNPFVGIYIYVLFEYLRPYDIIPSLMYLKIPIIVIGVTTVSWLVKLARNKTLVWSRFSWLFFLFTALIAFTIFSADNYYFAMEISREFTLLFVIFVVATTVVDSFSKLRKLVWLMLLIHFYLAAKGIHNYVVSQGVTGGPQTSGIVGTSFLADENDFALALNVMIPFAFFTVTYSKKIFARLASLGILATLMFGVVSSFSRGGWIGLMVAMFYCLLRSKRKILSFSAAGVLFAALLLVAPSKYWEEIGTISDTKETTAATRINYWKAAVRMYLDYPVAGVGAGNGGPNMPQYVTGFDQPSTQWGRAFHGTLPQILAELGTIGMLLYLSMLFLMFKYLIRIRKGALANANASEVVRYANSLMGAVLAYLATATFLSTAYYPQLWTMFTFAVILTRLYHDKFETESAERTEVINDPRLEVKRPLL